MRKKKQTADINRLFEPLHIQVTWADDERQFVHCNTLQYTATHCNTLQHTATHCNALQRTAIHCSTLQHNATHCNTLQIGALQSAHQNEEAERALESPSNQSSTPVKWHSTHNKGQRSNLHVCLVPCTDLCRSLIEPLQQNQKRPAPICVDVS